MQSNGEYERMDDTRGGDMEMIVGGNINLVQLALSTLVLLSFRLRKWLSSS